MEENNLPELVKRSATVIQSVYAQFITKALKSDNTRGSYQRNFNHCFSFCGTLEPTLDKVSAATLEKYRVSLSKKYKASSVRQHVASIKRLFAYLTAKGALASDPSTSLIPPKIGKTARKKERYPQKFYGQVLRSVESSTIKGKRNRAIIALLMDLQLRPGQLVKLKRKDLVNSKGSLRIRIHKSHGTVFTTALSGSAASELQSYINEAKVGGTGYLFQSFGGNAKDLSGNPLNVIDVSRMLEKAVKKANRHPSLLPI